MGHSRSHRDQNQEIMEKNVIIGQGIEIYCRDTDTESVNKEIHYGSIVKIWPFWLKNEL